MGPEVKQEQGREAEINWVIVVCMWLLRIKIVRDWKGGVCVIVRRERIIFSPWPRIWPPGQLKVFKHQLYLNDITIVQHIKLQTLQDFKQIDNQIGQMDSCYKAYAGTYITVPLIFRSTSLPPFLLLTSVTVTQAQESRMLPPSSSLISLHTGGKMLSDNFSNSNIMTLTLQWKG